MEKNYTVLDDCQSATCQIKQTFACQVVLDAKQKCMNHHVTTTDSSAIFTKK